MKQEIKIAFSSKGFWLITALVLVLMLFSLAMNINLQQSEEAAVLKQGSRGQAVIDVQTRLKNWGYYSGSVDGIYGSQTRKAVRLFQSKNGLSVDGIVGNATYKALGLNQYVSSSVSSAGSNEMLLAKAIHAEAEGESYIGKVAVGAVLLNRVDSPSFPNSLSGVIYQSLALESVANGRFNTAAGQESIRAARDAINGWDPTYGCLYFWNPAKTGANSWVWSRQIIVEYGNHVFAK
ncbi:MAG: spore cortex-lytic enzyme [Firmicutes bacterium]|nr:spore cortex-lytic enzyme [Bacillota bacterium]